MNIKDKLGKLNKQALIDLRDYIDVLIAEKEQVENESAVAEESTGPQDSGGGKDKGGKGWIEVKMIGKSGPYAYRRWYEGKRKKSKYLGKVKGGAG